MKSNTISIKADRQYDDRRRKEFHWKAGETKKLFLSFNDNIGYGKSEIFEMVLDSAIGLGASAAMLGALPFLLI